MFVGVCRCTVLVTASHSLKDKRSVLRRMKDRVRERLGVQLAEVGGQDTWQRADLAFAVVAGERDPAQHLADGVLRSIAGIEGAQLAAVRVEVVPYGDDWFAEAAREGRAWDAKTGVADTDDQAWVPSAWLEDKEP